MNHIIEILRLILKGEIKYHGTRESDWNVTLVDTGLNTLKGGRIKRVEKYLSDKTNMITYGDGVSDININALVKFHKSHGKTVTITGVYPPSRFGEMTEKDNVVMSFEEKPQTSVGLINGGFMVFNNNLLDYLNDGEDCDFEFGALENLAKKVKLWFTSMKESGNVWIVKEMLNTSTNYGNQIKQNGKCGNC